MPAGLRAMSLPLDTSRAVGGALSASDRVDVIGFDESGPFYIATDVVVLDVPAAGSGAFGSSAGYAVTLAVTDEQALMLAQALTEVPARAVDPARASVHPSSEMKSW